VEIVLLSGLPRTGSTLLQNILVQNPRIQADGYSALCQVMWDAKVSCEHNAVQLLTGVGKDVSFRDGLLKNIPGIYYPSSTGKIVFDKGRTWVNEPNIAMARQYIAKDIKAVVLVRPIEEIVASFARVAAENGAGFSYEGLLSRDSEFLREVHATSIALNSDDPSFLFVSYDDIVADTANTLGRIYRHIGADRFIHNTQRVKQTVFEDDARNNLQDLHTIRPKIAKRINDVVLPDWVRATCAEITGAFLGANNGGKLKWQQD